MQWVASMCAHCPDHPWEADTAAPPSATQLPVGMLRRMESLPRFLALLRISWCEGPQRVSPGVKAEDLYSGSDHDCGVTARLGPPSGLAAPLFNTGASFQTVNHPLPLC